MGIKAYNFGAPPRFKDIRMSNFKGVDFANDNSEVDLHRSPDAKNVLSSYSDVIEKRTGYAVDATLADSIGNTQVNAVYVWYDYFFSRTLHLAHVGYNVFYYSEQAPQDGWLPLMWVDQTYLETETPTNRYITQENRPSKFFQLPNGQLFHMGAGKFVHIGEVVFNNSTGRAFGACDFLMSPRFMYDVAYIPTTTIARAPTGGGEPYEPINMLTSYRKNTFLGDAGSVAYLLDATGLEAVDTSDNYHGFTYVATELMAKAVQVKKLNASGNWDRLTEGTDFTVNRTTGVVTFNTAPGVSPQTGVDNIEIIFSKYSSNRTKFLWVTEYAFFGFNGVSDYLFMGGGGSLNTDYMGWWTDVENPSTGNGLYFPETGYSTFGNQFSPLMGYGRFGDYMIVYKGASEHDSGIYLREIGLDANNEVIFPISQSVSTIGTLSPRSILSLRDDPMWLSDIGVVALITNNITNVKAVQDRGYYVNKRLLAEPNLDKAMASIHDNMYVLAIPNTDSTHIYVADPRKKYHENKAVSESWQYEWYYWELPVVITSMSEYADVLYFGTSTGKVCRFRTKDDGNAYYDDQTPVACYWKSPLLYMDDITAFKTLKNFWARMVQYSKSSAKIYYNVRGALTMVKNATFDMFSFENIDFNRFTFDTDDNAEILVTNRMERQFMAIQFMIMSDQAESFGLIEMVARFRTNSTYKGG